MKWFFLFPLFFYLRTSIHIHLQKSIYVLCSLFSIQIIYHYKFGVLTQGQTLYFTSFIFQVVILQKSGASVPRLTLQFSAASHSFCLICICWTFLHAYVLKSVLCPFMDFNVCRDLNLTTCLPNVNYKICLL